MDLVRQLLLRIEDHPEEWFPIQKGLDDLAPERVGAHLVWLCEAGLLRSDAHHDLLLAGHGHIGRVRLTWAGSEFLDAARDETIWKRAKSALLTATGGLTFELLSACLIHEAFQELGFKA